jgi:hypothetical protein
MRLAFKAMGDDRARRAARRGDDLGRRRVAQLRRAHRRPRQARHARRPARRAVGAPAPAAPAATDELGDAGKRALDAERVRAKEAEKRARAAEQRAKALEDASLSETEKLKREAEEGRSLAERATGKLRRANLISALADEGFSGAKARAAAKLVEGVEYDDDDEPTNLKQALKSAEREYGDLVKPAPAPATDFDGGARSAAPPSSMDALIRRAAGRSTL